jgi:hypothetical protein
VIFLAQTALFMASVGGIIVGTLSLIFFAGGAMNRARPADMRRRRASWLCFAAAGLSHLRR